MQSNQFDTSPWLNARSSDTSGQTGYDGSSDAWLFTDTIDNGTHLLYHNVSHSGIVTFSVYAKANTIDWLEIRSYSGGDTINAFFDLANGVLGDALFRSAIDAKIESVGNGWYRCSVTGNTNGTNTYVRIALADSDNGATYTGTGNGSIYIQNAQLETGLVATDYLDSGATTAKAGVLIDLPRINYDANGENGALLLEPQRQQLIQYSEYFGASYWTKSGASVVSGFTSPEGLGNAYKLVEDTNNGGHQIYSSFFSGSAGNNYTTSFFVKAGERTWCRILTYGGTSVFFDLENGVKGTESNATGSIEPLENDWYKISSTYSSQSSERAYLYIAESDGVASYQGDGSSGIYVYGAQAEAGSYSTSYIPNHGTSGGVTRAADNHDLPDITSLIGNTQGSWFMDWEIADSSTRDNSEVGFELSSDDNRDELNFSVGSDGNMRMFVRADNNYSQKYATSNKSGKWCLVWNGTSLKLFQNGVEVYSDASALIYNDYTTYEGNPNLQYKVKQVIIFPTALTDAECITLTTL